MTNLLLEFENLLYGDYTLDEVIAKLPCFQQNLHLTTFLLYFQHAFMVQPFRIVVLIAALKSLNLDPKIINYHIFDLETSWIGDVNDHFYYSTAIPGFIHALREGICILDLDPLHFHGIHCYYEPSSFSVYEYVYPEIQHQISPQMNLEITSILDNVGLTYYKTPEGYEKYSKRRLFCFPDDAGFATITDDVEMLRNRMNDPNFNINGYCFQFCNDNYSYYITIAARYGSIRTFKFLLLNGAEINVSDIQAEAARSGCIEILKVISDGAETPEDSAISPAIALMAIDNHHQNILEWSIINKNINPEFCIKESIFSYNFTALKFLVEIIEQNPDIKPERKAGLFANGFKYAFYANNIVILNYFIEKGVDPKAITFGDKRTDDCFMCDNIEALKFMIERYDLKVSDFLLYEITTGNALETLEYVLGHLETIEEKEHLLKKINHLYPMVIIMNGMINYKTLDILLKHGLAPNGVVIKGSSKVSPSTFLELTITEGGSPELVRSLLKAGADPNRGITRKPLEAVFQTKTFNMIMGDEISLLLEFGADINEGILKKPFQCLCECTNPVDDIIILFLEKGAKTDYLTKKALEVVENAKANAKSTIKLQP